MGYDKTIRYARTTLVNALKYSDFDQEVRIVVVCFKYFFEYFNHTRVSDTVRERGGEKPHDGKHSSFAGLSIE